MISSVLIGTVLTLVLIGVVLNCGPSDATYKALCNTIAETSEEHSEWHLAIYLDIRSCLSCCEDMKAWQELEEKLPQCGGAFSLWAPREDSLDVAVAMELEGLKTPVRVLSEETVEALRWGKVRTPVKVLFNNRCELEKITGPSSGPVHSRHFVEQLLSEVCSGQRR